MERLVTTSQAAEILGLSLQGVHYRIKKEQLKSIKKAGKTFVYISDEDSNSSKKYTKVEARNSSNEQVHSIIAVKDEQIELLKKTNKLMRKQYISEISRLEKNQKQIIEVFNSEIKLLQSAFNEMRSVYKPQIENFDAANVINKDKFISLEDFLVIMKRHNKSSKDIKNIIIKAISNRDNRFIYNKSDKKLLILNSDFSDLV